MRTILTETFTGDRRTIPGTTTGWNYELTIVETTVHRFTITVKEIPGNPANACTKTHDCYMDVNGIFYWCESNNIIPPDTCVETFVARIPMYHQERQSSVYRADLSVLLSQYRAEQANRPVTHEERFEATAAYGYNKTVVDVLSGRRFRTLKKKI